MVLGNILLLVGEALLYFAVLATLFRLRHRFGFGVFVAALGTMHFLETYLAAILYVDFPFGIVFSPGSTVLFAGKLAMLLLVYIREDAAAVRQPIYGLLIGNLLTVALVLLVRLQVNFIPLGDRVPDFALMDQMGGMMVWGTILLFVDAIGMILLYEKSAKWLGNRRLLRIGLSLAAVLTVDQLGFFGALRVFVGADVDVLYGGWVGKMFALAIYAGLVSAYLRWFDHKSGLSSTPRLTDVFDTLTYRQRYEALLERSGHDGLTGLLDRGRLDRDGPSIVDAAIRAQRPASLLVVDVDHFKQINDRYGHARGDDVLRVIAAQLSDRVRGSDRVYRYGGEEFVVVSGNMNHGSALMFAERVRHDIAGATAELGNTVTVSIGVATCPRDATDFASLFAVADERLYEAKRSGRDRVVGGDEVATPVPKPAANQPPVMG